MKTHLLVALLLLLVISGSVPRKPQVTLTEAFPNLKFDQPVELIQANDGSGRMFVIAQKGVIHAFPNQSDVKETKEFLNITGDVVDGGERGLLGLAFHPDFKSNGYFYVNYTAGDPLETRISRFQVTKNSPDKVDPKTELVLLTYRQPYNNHNGGKIAFGPDGYLYISAGDGGSGGDPQNNSQDLTRLLGKIMRIDVNTQSGDRNYGIPKDNPFAGNNKGYREEIYAYGLRNVWKFSFDQPTNTMWAGDVGQNSREEVSVIQKGGNYGWKIMEGMVCFTGRNSEVGEDCETKGLIKPVYEYLHSSGMGQSVTGGYVYRGKQMPQLAGKYIFGDYQSGIIWALNKKADGTYETEQLFDMDGLLSSFGEDNNKELYVCSYADGKIMKLAMR